jgi:hypothetical protein
VDLRRGAMKQVDRRTEEIAEVRLKARVAQNRHEGVESVG